MSLIKRLNLLLLKMKFKILYIVFISAGLFANGQNYSSGSNYITKITPENHLDLYNFTKNHLPSTNLDSLEKIFEILERLNKFDSSVYSIKTLSPVINNIEKNITSLLMDNLNGTWHRKWDIFSALMCGEIINYNGNQIMSFTQDSIFLYNDNILQKKYSYTISRKNKGSLFYINNFQIVTSDEAQKWKIHYYDKTPFEPEFKTSNASYLSIQLLNESSIFNMSAVYIKPFAL